MKIFNKLPFLYKDDEYFVTFDYVHQRPAHRDYVEIFTKTKGWFGRTKFKTLVKETRVARGVGDAPEFWAKLVDKALQGEDKSPAVLIECSPNVEELYETPSPTNYSNLRIVKRREVASN